MKKLMLVMVVLAISLMMPSSFAFACAGGGGGDGGGNDDDFAMGGAVSWGGHPGYPDVIGSSVWDCNPVGPFQEGTAIEDSVQDLIDGFQKGKYTKDDVKKSLAWAKGVGISINSAQRAQLDKLMNPPPQKKVKKSKNSKLMDKIEKGLNIWASYNKSKTKNKGKPPSKIQIGASLIKEEIKSYVPSEYQSYVDSAFDFFGF